MFEINEDLKEIISGNGRLVHCKTCARSIFSDPYLLDQVIESHKPGTLQHQFLKSLRERGYLLINRESLFVVYPKKEV